MAETQENGTLGISASIETGQTARNAEQFVRRVSDMERAVDALTKSVESAEAKVKGIGAALGQTATVKPTGVKASGEAARNAATQFGDMSSSVREANEALTNIGGGIGSFVKQFGLAALTIGGLQQALQGLKGSIDTIMSFQTANAQLQAILGASDEEMQGFKETAEALGRSTVFTASQVTELQTALSKLGFVAADIHAMEEPVLHFAQATGASLDEAASTAGAALRMFGVAQEDYATETQRFTNAMASATMSSALDFQMIRDNLATFGPMAHSMGLKIEDTLALFGKLKDAGGDASTAMTSLRNIFTKVAQNKIPGMGEVKTLDDFVAGLKKLRDVDSGAAMKMIGARGGTQMLTLIQEADKILELRDRISQGMNADTTGGMAEKMTNNLSGSLKMLTSAWEGFVLTFQESDGIAKDFIDTITEGIGKLREFVAASGDWKREDIERYVDGFKALIAIIAVYKTVTMSVAGAKALNAAFERKLAAQQIADIDKAVAGKNAEAAAEGRATLAVKAHTAALREKALAEIQAKAGGGGEIATLQAQIAILEGEIAASKELTAEQTRQVALLKLQGKEIDANNAQLLVTELTEKRHTVELEKQGLQKQLQAAEDKALIATGQQRLAMEAANGVAVTANIGKMSKLRAAMSLTGLDMLANPYVVLAAAIAAVGYAVYKMATSLTVAQQALKGFNDAVAETNKQQRDATAKAVSDAKGGVASLILLTKTYGAAAASQKEYIDNLAALKEQMKEYGLSLQTTHDDHGREVADIDTLVKKRDELTAAIEREGAARAETARLKAIYAEEEKQYANADTTAEESLKDEGIDNAGLVVSAMKSDLSREDLELLKQYTRAENEYNRVVAESPNNAEGAEQRRAALTKMREAFVAYNGVLFEGEKRIREYGKQLGWNDGQIKAAIGIQNKLYSSYGATAGMAEYLAGKISGAAKSASRAAEIAAKSIQDLKKDLQALAKKYNIEINLDYKTKGAIPEWMKDKFNLKGKVTQRQIDELGRNEAAYQYIAEKGGGIVSGKKVTGVAAAYRASQYGVAKIWATDKLAQQKQDEPKATKATTSSVNTEGQNEALRRREQEQRRKELEKQTAKEREEAAFDAELDLWQAKIDGMDEGFAKYWEQRKLKEVRDTHAADKEYQDKLDQYVRQQKQLWDADPAHQKQTARKEKKDKSGNVTAAARSAHDAVQFDEDKFKATDKGYLEYEKKLRAARDERLNAVAHTASLPADKYDDQARKNAEKYRTILSDIAAIERVINEESQKAKPDGKRITNLQEQRAAARAALIDTSMSFKPSSAVPDTLKGYEEKRADSEAKWQGVIDTLETLLRSETDAKHIEELRRAIVKAETEGAREQMSLDFERLTHSDDYVRAFENLDRTSSVTLKRLMRQFESVKRSAARNLNPEDLKQYTEAIERMREELSRRDPFGGANEALQRLRTATEELKRAKADLAKIEKGGVVLKWDSKTFTGKTVTRNEAQRNVNTKQDEVNAAAADAADNIQKAGELIAEQLAYVGEKIGGVAGQIVSSIGSIAGNMSQGIAGAKQGGFEGWASAAQSVVNSITSGVMLIDSLPSAFEKANAKQQKLNAITDSVYEYIDAVREARQEEEAWFTKTSIGSLRQDLEDNADAIDKYNAKLDEQQVKYQNAKSGLSKTWGAIAGGIGGTVLGVIAGTVGTMFMGPVGTALGMAISTAVGTAVGTTTGVAATAAVNALTASTDKVAARDNLRVQTRHRTFFRSEKTQDLQSWINDNMRSKAKELGIDSLELFDKENNLNVELAKAVLDSGATLVGETRDTLQDLINYQEKVNEYQKNLEEYVSNLYSPLLDDMNKALWEWVDNGRDAMDAFYDYAASTFKNIGQEITKEMINTAVFDGLKDKLKDITDKYIRGDISEDTYSGQIATVTDEAARGFEDMLPKLKDFTEHFSQALSEAGIDLDASSNEATGTVNSAMSITEDTANEMIGILTAQRIAEEGVLVNTAEIAAGQVAIGADVAQIRAAVAAQQAAMNDVADLQRQGNAYLSQIATNTRELFNVTQQLQEIKQKL